MYVHGFYVSRHIHIYTCVHIHMPLIVINFRETEVSMKNLVPCSSSFQGAQLAHWTLITPKSKILPSWDVCEGVGKLFVLFSFLIIFWNVYQSK